MRKAREDPMIMCVFLFAELSLLTASRGINEYKLGMCCSVECNTLCLLRFFVVLFSAYLLRLLTYIKKRVV